MKNDTFCIGLMSGTSLDGLDICYVRFDDAGTFEILHAETINYTADWRKNLSEAYQYSAMNLCELDVNFGYFLGEQVKKFMQKYEIKDVDFVASHGQTIFHQPKKSFTLQIGNGAAIASRCQQKVVCDFRTQDVVLGGQGAPLVPIGDELLFHQYDACLNLGGFSNISLNRNQQRIAFDICPINTLLNHFSQKIGKDYDDEGKLAEQGTVNQDLFDKLNHLEFYHQKGPKSLGIEQVNELFLPLIDRYKISDYDILATLVEHMAFQISNVIKNKKSRLLITGGGAYNRYLINRIQSYLPDTQVELGSKELIEFKEAIIFAFLGVLRITNKINVLSSVTGASKDHCSGIIFN